MVCVFFTVHDQVLMCVHHLFLLSFLLRKGGGKGREGKGREGKGREGRGEERRGEERRGGEGREGRREKGEGIEKVE